MPLIVPLREGALPWVAPVAVQQGRYVAMLIRRETPPDQRRPFVYADRGMLATIGRAQAVAQFGLLRLSGLTAWLVWCVVDIFLLIEFRSRVRVMSEWVWYLPYDIFKPGARIIYTLQRHSGEEERTPSSAFRGIRLEEMIRFRRIGPVRYGVVKHCHPCVASIRAFAYRGA